MSIKRKTLIGGIILQMLVLTSCYGIGPDLFPSFSSDGSINSSTSAPSPTPFDQVNYLNNSNVEVGYGGTPHSWKSWSNGNTTFVWDNDISYSGISSLKISQDIKAFAVWYQNVVGLIPEKSYTLSGYIKTDNVDPGQSAACFRVACKDPEGKILSTYFSKPISSTRDWTFVSCSFMIPTGTSSVEVNCNLKDVTGTAWFDDIKITEDASMPTSEPSPEAIDGYPVLKVTEQANDMLFEAFGAEWDPRFWIKENRKRGVTQEDWDLIKKRIKDMNLKKVRMMALSIWFEPLNDDSDPDNINWDGFSFEDDINSNDNMYSMYRYLDVCQELNIDVTLSFWGFNTNNWLGFSEMKSTSWCSAPNNLEEAAENISAFLQYLINVRGYTCVKELVLYNEPYGSFYDASGYINFDYYVDYYKAVHDRLVDDDLRDKIKMIGDDTSKLYWFNDVVHTLDIIVDKYDSHTYMYDANVKNVGFLIRDFVWRRTSIIDKPFFFGEFGTGNIIGSHRSGDVDTYDRGLYLPVFCINTLKAGGSTACVWTLHDVYYDYSPWDTNNYGLMEFGLWAYKDKSWKLRPSFFSYSLLTKYTLPDSTVYDIAGGGENIDAVSLLSPEGKWTYLIVNRENEDADYILTNNMHGSDQLDRYLFSESMLPSDDSIIKSDAIIEMENGKSRINIPARSFVILTSIQNQE